jgi:uncharacterized protein YfaT (DUF1175 family)
LPVISKANNQEDQKFDASLGYILGWHCGSNGRAPASMRPIVQIPVLPKKSTKVSPEFYEIIFLELLRLSFLKLYSID